MPELDDQRLLEEFAGRNSETAFAVLVARHVNLVYSAALRFTRNPHHAEEITQAVFIILARKAGSLRRDVVLSGWLYQTTRLTSANFVKGEIRRQRREQEVYMQSTLNGPDAAAWEEIRPLLDDAMGGLGKTDRNAVVLRFFENKTAREVAAALKLTEAASHKRVNRALDKLRKFLAKHGVTSTTNTLAGMMSAHSVHSAPAGLAKTMSTVALAKGAAVPTSTLTLVKGALKLMAWNKIKFAIRIGTVILLASGGLTIAYSEIISNHLAALRILKEVEARYASFTSYSYNAKDIFKEPGMTNLSTFSVRLARPCLYRIESQSVFNREQTNKSAIWSTGDFAYSYSSFTNKLYRKKYNLKEWIAQMGSLHLDKMLPTCIPTCFFFNPDTNDLLRIFSTNRSGIKIKLLKDEKIGQKDCHVLALTFPQRGLKLTMWIGKSDCLIYQTEQDIERAIITPKASYPGTLEETYRNISMDVQFSKDNFVPKVPNGLVLSGKLP